MPGKIKKPNNDTDQDIIAFLKEKNISDFLGGGQESWVYAVDDTHILRICRERMSAVEDPQKLSSLIYAQRRKAFYEELGLYKLPFALPKIYNVSRHNDIIYTLEHRIQGISLHEAFVAYPEHREVILKNYFNAMEALNNIELDDHLFGVILTTETTIPYTTKHSWSDYLFATIAETIKSKNDFLIKSGINITESILERIQKKIKLCCDGVSKHHLVHGDVFPPNMMINPKTFEVTAIIDFSDLTVVGDHRLDIAASLLQTEYLEPYGELYAGYMQKIIHQKYGDDLNEIINLYRIYYSFMFLEKWSINNLKNIDKLLDSKALWSPFQAPETEKQFEASPGFFPQLALIKEVSKKEEQSTEPNLVGFDTAKKKNV